MKFLVDECTGPAVAEWLSQKGFDVYSVYSQHRGMRDEDVLNKANAEDYILITNDKDFGEMIYRQQRPHKGVIFLRLSDERYSNKIRLIDSLLENYLDRLANSFVVVTETRVKFARRPQ